MSFISLYILDTEYERQVSPLRLCLSLVIMIIYFNVAGTDHHSEWNISILVANEYLLNLKKMNSWLHFFKAPHSFKGLIFQLKMNLSHIMFNCTSLIKQLSPCYPNLSCMHNFKTDFALKFRNIYIGNFAHYSVLFIIIHF